MKIKTAPPAPPPPRAPIRAPFKRPPAPCALTTRDTDGLVASMRKTADLHHKMAEDAKRKKRLDAAWLHYGVRDGTRSAITDVLAAIRRAQGRGMSPRARRDTLEGVDLPTRDAERQIREFLEWRFDDAPPDFWVGANALLKVLLRSPDLRTAYATMRSITNEYLTVAELREDRRLTERSRWIIKGMAAVMQMIGKQFPTGHVE